MYKHTSGQYGMGKRKVKHYAYSPEDRIGKGYSSVVYRGINENNSITPII